MRNHVVAASRAKPEPSRARRLSTTERVGLVFMAFAIVAASLLSAPVRQAHDIATTQIRVRPGDSLWSIASAHPVDGVDTARTADMIAEINGLHGASLRAGSAILVPKWSLDERIVMR